MEVSIVLNGDIKNGRWFKNRLRGTVIAADGGADWCKKFGITPDYIVGDFDSVSQKTLSAFRKTSLVLRNRSQNSTDFEKALSVARKLKAKTIFVFGGFGGELDHEIANVLSLNSECVMQNEKQTVRVTEKRIDVRGKRNGLISVIALSDTVGLRYEDLKWQAPKGKLSAGWIGVRNRFTKGEAVLALKRGRIAVITDTI